MLRNPMRATEAQATDNRCAACGGPLDMRNHTLRCGEPILGGIIARCTSCGSDQVRPRPSPERIAELYDGSYYEGFIEGPGVAGGNFEVSPVLQGRLRELERRVGKGRLLDVGCGLGHFVKYAVDNGWSAAGLETSPWAAEQGRLRNKVVIHQCSIAEAPIEPASLDVVHANHVVEHMLDPVAELQAAGRLLRSGGFLVVEVPQELAYPLSDRLFRSLHPDLYRTPPPSVTHHLTFFTPRGLATAARRAGFTIDTATTVRHLRTTESRIPFGGTAKRLLYWSEAALQTAPDIELWASKP
jgi:SAM-dependent methyltransferase